jgi:hypothetical protein
MDDVQSGLGDVIVKVIVGIAIAAFLAAFRILPSMEPYFWMVDIVGWIGFGTFVLAIHKWSFGYIIGWASGAWVLLSSGLMHSEEIIVNIAVPIIILVLRLYLFIKKEVSF